MDCLLKERMRCDERLKSKSNWNEDRPLKDHVSFFTAHYYLFFQSSQPPVVTPQCATQTHAHIHTSNSPLNKHAITRSLLKPGAERRRHRQQIPHLLALLHRLQNPAIHVLLPFLLRSQVHDRRQAQPSLHVRVHVARREVARLSDPRSLQQQPHVVALHDLRVHLHHFFVPLESLRSIARRCATKAKAHVDSWKLPSS